MKLLRDFPALRGGLLATAAALLFGASTPLVQLAGAGVGAFATAALLYAGAAAMSVLTRQPPTREAGLRRTDLPRLLAMAVFGAVVGPVALAWGLQRTGGAGASLMLAAEALFTALLATLLYREAIDRRVGLAMALLTAGGMLLLADRRAAGATQLLGLGAVLVATVAWAVDNALSRGVAERDPAQVVLAKSGLGACAASALAIVAGEPLPPAVHAVALLAIGATGYGLSLRLYLLAQRSFGAARTGSVFAFAPFIGAALAIGLGDREAGWGLAAGAVLMFAGVAIHLGERHDHEHLHETLDHEHAHRHDDGHHDHHHHHEAMPATGWHSHPHRHSAVRHRHPHVPDAHHGHPH